LTGPERKPRPDDLGRQQRDRAIVPALMLLILASCLLYVQVAVEGAREIALRDARARNLATAMLGARLIDEQCDAALAALGAAARHQFPPEVRSATVPGPRGPASRAMLGAAAQGAIQRHLRDDLVAMPDLALVAVYRADGVLLASAPSRPRLARSVGRSEWFAEVVRDTGPHVGDVVSVGGSRGYQALRLAVPVGELPHPGAYLIGFYRLQAVQEWLQPLQIGGSGTLSVADARGRPIATSGAPGTRPIQVTGHAAVRRALDGFYGTMEAPRLDGAGKALVGFAPARAPGWAVVASQPLAAALAPADHLLHRLLLLVLPLLALMAGAGAAIEFLYRRQARLARRNAELSGTLALQNERLRAADRAKSEFLANVSHDLRTPLASIKASVTGLLEPDLQWDQRTLQGFLTLVNEETDRLTARVRNLLDMARLEAQALPMQKELCDLTDIVASALERVQPLTRGRAIEADFPAESLLVEADYTQIETVIVNLLENAVKYSPPGTALHLRGAVCRIEGRRQKAEGSPELATAEVVFPPSDRLPSAFCLLPSGGDAALFSLRDAGPGLAPGDEERVFEKFYRAASVQAAGGTGLGLAICKAIVEAHGGTIGVVSGREGAEFWFTLPLARYPAGAAAEREEAEVA
jgi:signal transduction histidine kinase